MFQTKRVVKFTTHVCVQKLFLENRTSYEIMWKHLMSGAGHS
jgi:hypothetical protein